MEISSLLGSLQSGSLASIFHYANDNQGEQEGKNSTVFSYSVQSDRVSISQEAMQLAAKSESAGQEESENGFAGSGGASGGGSSSDDNTSKINELQSKLQGLQGKLATAMQKGNEAEAMGIQGQITAVMAEIAALQGSGV